MKTRNLLLGMACMAAFTACSNNEEPVAPAAQTRTVTINVNTGADTRTNLAVDGTGLKRTWASTDQLSIYFKDADGNKTLELFQLKSGAGTTSAVFEKSDSKLPATGTTKVLVWVDPENRNGRAFDISVQDGTLDDYRYGLVNNDWLTTETTVTDGEFPASLSLESKSIFLKIPAGTKLINDVTGDQYIEIMVYGPEIVNRYDFDIDDAGNFEYNIDSSSYGHVSAGLESWNLWIALKDGALVDDCYISMMARGNIGDLMFIVTDQTTTIVGKDLMMKSLWIPLEFGYIYTIQQSDVTPIDLD